MQLLKKKKKTKTKRQFHIINDKSPFSFIEAYRSLRTNLSFVSVSNEYNKIVVTSAIPAEGKSTVVINLAISLAQDGKRVVVVDCDLRKPMIHNYLKLNSRSKGLTTVLSGKATCSDVLVGFKDLGIYAIPAGVLPPNPSELLSSKRMQQFIEELSGAFDYVLFDTPPVSVVTDAAVLSRFADGVVLVTRQKHATIESIKLALKNLQSVNANVLGVVLNDFDTKQIGKESGYYYSYEYDYANKE